MDWTDLTSSQIIQILAGSPAWLHLVCGYCGADPDQQRAVFCSLWSLTGRLSESRAVGVSGVRAPVKHDPASSHYCVISDRRTVTHRTQLDIMRTLS